MANEHTKFWLALLAQGQDMAQRVRLWNGYLGWRLPPHIKGEGEPQSGWPQLIVDPPDGGWPELIDEEYESIKMLAKEHGGYPDFRHHDYMDFSDHIFLGKTDLSGLVLVGATFERAKFGGDVKLSYKTRFYSQAWFDHAVFEGHFSCERAQFDAPVSFTGSHFKQYSDFIGTKFMGGASFANVTFEGQVMFNDSIFEERYFSGGIIFPYLADFRNAKFQDRASFREVLFGNDESAYSRRLWPERRADFTDVEFTTTTDFRGATFGGAPAFFNAKLHEDTDLGRIDWEKADTDNIPVDYAIRAWERLELMMSELEKPFDRHQFFRLKMRARRRSDGILLRIVNWMFDKTCDYGWGVSRAFACWFGHWIIFAVILFMNAMPALNGVGLCKIALASIGASFANAHAFLFLTAEEGYLEKCLLLLKKNDEWGLVTGVGVAETILGPILLFLLLLTLRNRFRLA